MSWRRRVGVEEDNEEMYGSLDEVSSGVLDQSIVVTRGEGEGEGEGEGVGNYGSNKLFCYYS